MLPEPITRHDLAGGIRIYRLPVQAFPHLIANVYVVLAGDYAALVDTGSGLGASNEQLRAGMDALRSAWGETLTWADLRRIIITHGHIDHHGGLEAVRALTPAPVAVHELDRRILIHYEERRTLASHALASFLRYAGVPEPRVNELIKMYSWNKGLVRSVPVETTLHEGDLLDGLFRVYHAPGHCSGQVCLQIEDVLLSADHVLPRTSLFLSPERITLWTGLDHFLQALARIRSLPGIRLALGGHDAPITDIDGTIDRLAAAQYQRLDQVRTACAEPRTIADLTALVYPELGGYDALLALQKMGAYVEYLDQRGELAIANLDDVAADERVAPQYRVSGK